MSVTPIKIQTKVDRPIAETWELWTSPMHIIKWNSPSPEWHTTYADNDLKAGGKFCSRMEAKEGPDGFDFEGIYSKVTKPNYLEYTMEDGRKVKVSFTDERNSTLITEEFDPETINSIEMQRAGWQGILDNFKKYAEAKNDILKFEIKIKASPDQVFKKMLDKKSYKQWTTAFNPESECIGSWDKRASIRFLGVDDKGEKGGMISRIRENMPGKFLSIEHVGMIKGTKEITSGPEVDKWKGMLENYRFTPDGKDTHLEVTLDSIDDFKDYLIETWPKALVLLKKICES